MGIILGHRYLRRRAYALQSERGVRWSTAIAQIVGEGHIPPRVPAWQGDWDIFAATQAVLAEWDGADTGQRKLLQSVFRVWGLFDEHRRRLEGGDKWDRARSALVLGRLQFSEVQDALSLHLEAATGTTQAAIVNALALLGRPESCAALIGFLARSGARHRHTVLSALIACGRDEPQQLVPFLKHPQTLIREVTAEALASVAGVEELPALLRACDDPEPEVRARVARSLRRIADPGGPPALKKLAADPVWFVRLQAANALGECEAEGVEVSLLEMTCDSDWRVRGKAALALYRRARDPFTLLRAIQALDDRYALEAVVAALERDGVVWRAVEELTDPDPARRERSTALVRELLRVRRFACALYALETHPREDTRRAVLAIVMEQRREPDLLDHLKPLLESSRLDTFTRASITGMLQEEEG